jgi:hypothetical protein
MICALCKQERVLQNSHVIPEFMYTPLYDDKHRFHVLSSKNPKRTRHEQKGLREKLLCKDCEERLSEHERYVSLVFSGGIQVSSERNGNLVKIRGLNYGHFKLFGLSVLWRAGVSKLQFFEKVTLGLHEEPLRKLVYANDPGKPDEYGFFLAPIVANNRDIKDLMVQPTHSRLDGHLCYRFVFGGLVWVFVVSSHQPPKMFHQAFVNSSGEMLMLVSELRDLTFIGRAMKAVGEPK